MAKQKIDFNNMDLGFEEMNPMNNEHELVLKKVKINQLDENPENNNIYEIDIEADEFLKEDIRLNGILNPIIVIKSELHSGRYTIVSGHRRTRVAKELGMHEIEAREIIAKTPEEKAYAQVMLVTANSTQRDRKPSEKAKEIQYLKSKIQKCNIDNVAKWISNATKMSERSVYRYEKLAGQPKEIQEAVDKGKMTVKQAIGEKVMKEAGKKNANARKAVDINKTAKKIYSLVSGIECEVKGDNDKVLDDDSAGYLRESLVTIRSLLDCND